MVGGSLKKKRKKKRERGKIKNDAMTQRDMGNIRIGEPDADRIVSYKTSRSYGQKQSAS